jgi:hypothetical protein
MGPIGWSGTANDLPPGLKPGDETCWEHFSVCLRSRKTSVNTFPEVAERKNGIGRDRKCLGGCSPTPTFFSLYVEETEGAVVRAGTCASVTIGRVWPRATNATRDESKQKKRCCSGTQTVLVAPQR